MNNGENSKRFMEILKKADKLIQDLQKQEWVVVRKGQRVEIVRDECIYVLRFIVSGNLCAPSLDMKYVEDLFSEIEKPEV